MHTCATALSVRRALERAPLVRARLCVFFGDAGVTGVFDGQSPATSLKLAAAFCFGCASHLSLLSSHRARNSDFKLTRLLLSLALTMQLVLSPVSVLALTFCAQEQHVSHLQRWPYKFWLTTGCFYILFLP